MTSTTVTRDPEYDDQDRFELLALQEVERQTCGRCGQHGGIVELPDEKDHSVTVTWAEHGERVVEVTMVRCVYCGALDASERIWRDQHKDDKGKARKGGKGKTLGGAIPADGRSWVAHDPV